MNFIRTTNIIIWVNAKLKIVFFFRYEGREAVFNFSHVTEWSTRFWCNILKNEFPLLCTAPIYTPMYVYALSERLSFTTSPSNTLWVKLLSRECRIISDVHIRPASYSAGTSQHQTYDSVVGLSYRLTKPSRWQRLKNWRESNILRLWIRHQLIPTGEKPFQSIQDSRLRFWFADNRSQAPCALWRQQTLPTIEVLPIRLSPVPYELALASRIKSYLNLNWLRQPTRKLLHMLQVCVLIW